MSPSTVEDRPGARGFSRRALSELQQARRAGIAAGTWPAHSVIWWQQTAQDARRRRREKKAAGPWDREALSLFPVVTTDVDVSADVELPEASK